MPIEQKHKRLSKRIIGMIILAGALFFALAYAGARFMKQMQERKTGHRAVLNLLVENHTPEIMKITVSVNDRVIVNDSLDLPVLHKVGISKHIARVKAEIPGIGACFSDSVVFSKNQPSANMLIAVEKCPADTVMGSDTVKYCIERGRFDEIDLNN